MTLTIDNWLERSWQVVQRNEQKEIGRRIDKSSRPTIFIIIKHGAKKRYNIKGWLLALTLICSTIVNKF